MPRDTQIEFASQSLRCFWPQEFTERRKFDRKAENQTYIEFLQREFDFNDNSYGDGDNGIDVDGSSEVEDNVERYSENNVSKGESQNNGEEVSFCDEFGSVELFMKGMIGDEDTLQYADQVEQVTRFCEQRRSKLEPKTTDNNTKRVAWLDDRNDRGTIIGSREHCRSYRNPLTAQELREELSRPRFGTGSDQNSAASTCKETARDADRRIIFISNLDASYIEVLVKTAARSQAPALKDLLYKHLVSRASIGVTLPSQGFLTFTLDLHLPHYVLRTGNELRKDSRKTLDGTPLRQSWDLSFLSRSEGAAIPTDKPNKGYFLYEAQTSIAIAGIDERIWVAYGFVDTYFESHESVDLSRQFKGCPKVPDLIAASQTDAESPIWSPRDYFLRVFAIRMNEVLREWNNIIAKIDDGVKQSRSNYTFSLSSNNCKSRQEIREFSLWNTQMVRLLRQLIKGLSATIEAWDKFARKEIGYFLFDGESGASAPLKISLSAIDNNFLDLKILRRKLQDLNRELCEDSPQGLHAQLSLENNEAVIFHQRTANNVRGLTTVTILSYALTNAAIISAVQVLPLAVNPTYFAYVLAILAFLITATLVVSVDWISWFQSIGKYARPIWNLRKNAATLFDCLCWNSQYSQLGCEKNTPFSASRRAQSQLNTASANPLDKNNEDPIDFANHHPSAPLVDKIDKTVDVLGKKVDRRGSLSDEVVGGRNSGSDPVVIRECSYLSANLPVCTALDQADNSTTAEKEAKLYILGKTLPAVTGLVEDPVDRWDIESISRTTNVHETSNISIENPWGICEEADNETNEDEASTDFCSSQSETGSSSCDYFDFCQADQHNFDSLRGFMAPVLDPMRQALVDRVMDQFWIVFNRGARMGLRVRAGESSGTSESSSVPIRSITSSIGTSLQPSQRKRQRGNDNDPDDDNQNDPGKPHQSFNSNRAFDSKRFACPFSKHDPRTYNIHSHRVCSLSHWDKISRVKYRTAPFKLKLLTSAVNFILIICREHLYRSHQMASHCKRCWRTFKTEGELDSHITVAAADICQVQPGYPPEGITPENQRRLRSRKKASLDQSDEDRWKDIYRLIFPSEEVPSPYFEPVQEMLMSPDSGDRTDYEQYIRRELPRLVRSSLEAAVSRDMQPLELSLIGNLERIIQDCQDRLSRDYRQPQRVNGEIRTPRGQDGAVYPAPAVSILMGEAGRSPDSYPQQSEFRNTEFQPPLAQVPQITLVTNEKNGSLDNSSAPEASDETLFSNFQYGSGQSQSCSCHGPCRCLGRANHNRILAMGTDNLLGLDEAMDRDVQWNNLNSNQPWSQINARNDDFDWWSDLEKGL